MKYKIKKQIDQNGCVNLYFMEYAHLAGIVLFYKRGSYTGCEEKGRLMSFIRNGKVEQMFLPKPLRGNTILGC